MALVLTVLIFFFCSFTLYLYVLEKTANYQVLTQCKFHKAEATIENTAALCNTLITCSLLCAVFSC